MDYSKAIDLWQPAIEIFRQLHNTSRELELAEKIGDAYKWMQQFEKAIPFYEEGLAVSRGGERPKTRRHDADQAGSLLRGAQPIRSGHQDVRRSHCRANGTNDRLAVAVTTDNLGVIYDSLGQYDKASPFTNGRFAMALEVKDQWQQSQHVRQSGRFLLRNFGV